MSSNEPSSWMSSAVGLNIPSLGVTTSTTVAECCNGVLSWWYGLQTNNNPGTNEEDEEALAEPLVVEQPALIMENRLQSDEEEASGLFLDEDGEDDKEQRSNPNSLAIENALVDDNNDSIHSPTNVLADEHGADKALSNPLVEKIESNEVFNVENAPLKDGAKVPSQVEFCADELCQDDDAQPTSSQMKQSPCQDEHEKPHFSLFIEKSSSQPINIENVLATIDDDDEECDQAVSSENDGEIAQTSSIFRSATPELHNDQDTPILDHGKSIQVAPDSSEDQDQVESIPTIPPRSGVKKRVSDLIGIFESLSMDEEDNNVTPTSLGSSSSFGGAKPLAHHDTSCPCCQNKIYPTDATIAYHDKLFHGGCFKCHLCDRKFSRGLSEVAGLVTKEDSSSSILTCTKCRDDAAVKHLPLRKSTPACQPITVTSPEKGNIQQVKDEIGDDLESVMDGMIPRCTICGIHFLGSGDANDMMIVGMNKYHPKCRLYGRPMVERSERKVLPIVAANYAPESLVVRLCNTLSDNDNEQQEQVMTTLYFILPDKATDLQRIRGDDRPNDNVSFEYTMDSSAYANPNYKGTKKNPKMTFPCHGVGNADSSLSVGFLGDPFGLPIRLANTRIMEDNGKLLFCAELECFKFQLRHRFDLVMHKKGELVDLKTATLSMTIR